jgi:ferredoxin/flavodoxin
MKAIICYYSGSGNTKLACEKIVRDIRNIEFTLFNIVTDGLPELELFDVVGFACFTDFGGIPFLMQSFIQRLKPQKQYSFVFNTYGFVSGKTLLMLQDEVAARGFRVFGGFSLHTPENYPPMITRGLANKQAPNENELKRFNDFILSLKQNFDLMSQKIEIKAEKISIGIITTLLPAYSRTKARKEMGEKFVNLEHCTKCGICQTGCPYHAIELKPFPAFDMEKCYGCWYCYNHCPAKAIYTKKMHDKGQYPKPIEQFKAKMV